MATKSNWRMYTNKVIVDVITKNPTVREEKELRRLISKAYPFGERAMHPYKIWCSEVKNCLVKYGIIDGKYLKKEYDPNQQELF